MKKARLLLGFIFVFVFFGCQNANEEPKAKYVFYFIGDGMGIQQVNATQAYLASLEGAKGNSSLSFTNFPVVGLSTTYAYNRYITGSAAAGTALATGTKTSINTIGLSHNHSDSLFSIAHYAQKNGFNVGVATSVSIDHATPSAFYAHQVSRSLYHEIAHDMLKSNYRFFAGGGFIDASGQYSKNSLGDIYELGKSNGYHFTNRFEVNDSILNTASTIVFHSDSPADGASIRYQIDNHNDGVTLSKIASMGINTLQSDKGFFFMVEGGKIDWACHDNDAAAVVHDVIDFSNAIEVAVEFYKKYPNETLIVVTADHETGGMSLGNRKMRYDSDIAILAKQKLSLEMLDTKVQEFFESNPKPKFNQLKEFIFSDTIIAINVDELSDEYDRMLKRAFEQTISASNDSDKNLIKREYGNHEPVAVTAVAIINEMAGIGWSSFSHTGSQVPVYALGVGQEKFSGQMDNTDIPKRIASVIRIIIE